MPSASLHPSNKTSRLAVTDLGTLEDVVRVDCSVHRSLPLMAFPDDLGILDEDDSYWDDAAALHQFQYSIIQLEEIEEYSLRFNLSYGNFSLRLMLSDKN